jgi:hypothetical protein
MVTKYKLLNWEFNKGAWAQALILSVDLLGIEFVAGVLQVSKFTVHNWIKMPQSAYGDFPHPSMSNFLHACNMLDLDPREFFILEDVV